MSDELTFIGPYGTLRIPAALMPQDPSEAEALVAALREAIRQPLRTPAGRPAQEPASPLPAARRRRLPGAARLGALLRARRAALGPAWPGPGPAPASPPQGPGPGAPPAPAPPPASGAERVRAAIARDRGTCWSPPVPVTLCGPPARPPRSETDLDWRAGLQDTGPALLDQPRKPR